MKKLLFLLFGFFFLNSAFAQTDMLNTVNMINNMNTTMLLAAQETQQNPQQEQVQSAPVVVNIQYQSDGTAVVTSPNAVVQYQSAMPTQTAPSPTEDNKTLEIILASAFGFVVGCMVMKMCSPTEKKSV
jgi:hypothetical protein